MLILCKTPFIFPLFRLSREKTPVTEVTGAELQQFKMIGAWNLHIWKILS